MKTSYLMNGKSYATMQEIATELGVSRVRPAQFEKYGITKVEEPEVKAEEVKAEEPEVKVEEPEVKVEDPEVKADEVNTEEVKAEEVKVKKKKTISITPTAWKVYTMEELLEMAKDNDVSGWKDSEDPRIIRMRVIMALKAAGLKPDETKVKAKKSKKEKDEA